MDQEVDKVENFSSVQENHEITCWGCGLRLILSSYSPIFKCGWCGAITNQEKTLRKADTKCFSMWRRLRDRFFVTVLFVFILFVICSGVWAAIYPVIFSTSYLVGIFHCTVTAVLSICTISAFFLASFKSAGEPARVLWGSYPVVVKGGLENYTFCTYCAKPKCPRTHHCRSCKLCVLDMDHHCPFIGNCVGAANHRHFIAFLIAVVVSCTYVIAMSTYVLFHTWPPLQYRQPVSLIRVNNLAVAGVLKEVMAALASSALLLPARGLVLIYLAMASFSVEVGISVLLWQQLHYIYEGKTLINHLKQNDDEIEERGCQNIFRFFCPYWAFRFLLGSSYCGRLQETSNLKTL